jgi:protein ImuB
MARILSVWSPNWAITCWRRRTPASARPADPFALVETRKNARRLAAIDAKAAAAGLQPGQTLADALALVPELKTADAEPEADAEALGKLSDWCVRFSPAVVPDAPDGLFLDVTGIERLWASERALIDDLLARLEAADIPAQAAVADTPGAAWAWARFGGSDPVVPSDAEAERLGPLPVEALRLEPETAAALRRLGLKSVEQVAALPRPQLARRFGRGLLLRLDQAWGDSEEALAFRRPPTPWFERLALVEPISTPEDLARTGADALIRICARLADEGRGARRFDLAFHGVDGRARGVRLGVGRAGRDPARLTRLLAPKLEAVDPGFGVEAVTVTADQVEVLAETQTRLDARGRDAAEEGLAQLVDRLANRLGEDRVWRFAPYESWTPERATARVPALAPVAGRGWDPERPRPLRLFRRPEPLEAVLSLVPDDPPMQFRWRGVTHRVRRAEGPERVAAEWWRRPRGESGPERIRDYYRVEDGEGARFWIFRLGLYGSERPSRWFVHGLFG